jgi:hypothetical protein
VRLRSLGWTQPTAHSQFLLDGRVISVQLNAPRGCCRTVEACDSRALPPHTNSLLGCIPDSEPLVGLQPSRRRSATGDGTGRRFRSSRPT